MGSLMTPENWRRLVFQQLADFLGVVDGEAGGHGYLLDANSILLNLRTEVGGENNPRKKERSTEYYRGHYITSPSNALS